MNFIIRGSIYLQQVEQLPLNMDQTEPVSMCERIYAWTPAGICCKSQTPAAEESAIPNYVCFILYVHGQATIKQ